MLAKLLYASEIKNFESSSVFEAVKLRNLRGLFLWTITECVFNLLVRDKTVKFYNSVLTLYCHTVRQLAVEYFNVELVLD